MSPILLLLVSLIVGTPLRQGLTAEQQYSVPEWANGVMEQSEFAKLYILDAHINPFCQRGDFDGDGLLDFAAFVRERSSGKIGIVFVHRSTKKFYVVGAGRPGAHGDDYAWVDAWRVFEKGVVPQGAGEGPPPKLNGDAMLVFKTESASAILWWTGTTY